MAQPAPVDAEMTSVILVSAIASLIAVYAISLWFGEPSA
jgi:hypothetical protein